MYAEVAKIYSKNESSVCEIVNKGEEFCATFAVAPQTTAILCDKCSVRRWKKALN